MSQHETASSLEYRVGDLANARRRLAAGPEPLRGWEWDFVARLCHRDLATLTGHTDMVISAVLSGRWPQGRRSSPGAPR